VNERPPRRPLPRETRLRSGAAFQRAYAHGARARGPLLVVVAVPNGLAHARLGLSVGKRVSKSAVRRNRVRRRLREAFRLRRPELGSGFDYVVIPAALELEPSFEELADELVRLAVHAAAKSRRRGATPSPKRTREGGSRPS
jgi:ribonuclease P protein component